MLSYETQLELNKQVVSRAYKTFSGETRVSLPCMKIICPTDLPDPLVPLILPTALSPLQYGYRTKTTPHFDAPVKIPRRQKKDAFVPVPTLPSGKTVAIGFNKVGTREVLDIEVSEQYFFPELPNELSLNRSVRSPLRSSMRP